MVICPEKEISTLLTVHCMHDPDSSVMRLYIPRNCDGLGYLKATDNRKKLSQGKEIHSRYYKVLNRVFCRKVAGSRTGDVDILSSVNWLRFSEFFFFKIDSQNWIQFSFNFRNYNIIAY